MAFYNETIVKYYIDLLINRGFASEEDRATLEKLFFKFHKLAVENARNWERYNNQDITPATYERNEKKHGEQFKELLKEFKPYNVKKFEFPGLYPVIILNNEMELFIFQ